jgi:hypothetical protein
MSATRIPVHHFNRVVAVVVVDEGDAARLTAFKWHLRKNPRLARSIGYAVRYEYCDGCKATIYMHRDVLGEQPFDGAEIDHISGDGLDNRRSNLRWVTHTQNCHNQPAHRDGSSGIRGVYWSQSERRWIASVRCNGRRWRGRFADADSATAAAREKRKELLSHAAA